MNDMKVFLTQKELAQRWKKSPQTLANNRSLNKGPSYTKIDGQIRYDLEDIIKIEEDSKVQL
jgi:hypothetical protein|tara:strand:+ start:241 stop:426 length:186 start_codon:yes stop_codon:yes gene_type:complete